MSEMAKKMIIRLCCSEFLVMIGSTVAFIGMSWILTYLSNCEIPSLSVFLKDESPIEGLIAIISVMAFDLNTQYAVNQIRYGAVRREMYQISQVCTALSAVLEALGIYLLFLFKCHVTQVQMVETKFIILVYILTVFVIYIKKNKMILQGQKIKGSIGFIIAMAVCIIIPLSWELCIKGSITVENSREMVSPLLIWVIAIALGIGIVSLCIWYIRRQLRMIHAYYMNVEVI